MLHSDEGNIFDLARHRLDVAKEDLETAISNLKEEHYRAANNRAYYSIYHSICAVFALENVAYKRHKDTLANFNKNYIKTEEGQLKPKKLVYDSITKNKERIRLVHLYKKNLNLVNYKEQ